LGIGHWRLRPRGRGFTVVELCFGLVVTALIMGAVASFLLAASQSWRYSDQVATSSMHAWQATVRLVRTMQDARLIGAVMPGDLNVSTPNPAAVIVWMKDTNQDGAIQGAECAMIEHDDVQQVLRLYPAGQGDATTVLPWATFTSQAVLNNFKVGRQFRPIGRGVERVRFASHGTSGTSQSPSLEYTIKLLTKSTNAGQTEQEDARLLEYGTCVVRAPAKQPA
jgi:hypothetical protein